MKQEEYKQGYLRITPDEGKILIHFPTMATYEEAIIKDNDLPNWGETDA